MTADPTFVDRAQVEAMLERALADPRQQFGSFFLSRLLGFQVSFEDDRCIVAFEATPALFNPQGTLHGGILATAMDVSMGHLLQHVDGAGATLTMTVQFLAMRRLVLAARTLDLLAQIRGVPGQRHRGARDRDVEASPQIAAAARRRLSSDTARSRGAGTR